MQLLSTFSIPADDYYTFSTCQTAQTSRDSPTSSAQARRRRSRAFTRRCLSIPRLHFPAILLRHRRSSAPALEFSDLGNYGSLANFQPSAVNVIGLSGFNGSTTIEDGDYFNTSGEAVGQFETTAGRKDRTDFSSVFRRCHEHCETGACKQLNTAGDRVPHGIAGRQRAGGQRSTAADDHLWPVIPRDHAHGVAAAVRRQRERRLFGFGHASSRVVPGDRLVLVATQNIRPEYCRDPNEKVSRSSRRLKVPPPSPRPNWARRPRARSTCWPSPILTTPSRTRTGALHRGHPLHSRLTHRSTRPQSSLG